MSELIVVEIHIGMMWVMIDLSIGNMPFFFKFLALDDVAYLILKDIPRHFVKCSKLHYYPYLLVHGYKVSIWRHSKEDSSKYQSSYGCGKYQLD